MPELEHALWTMLAFLFAGRMEALPLSHSVVPGRAAAEVAPLCVGAAIVARVLGGGALIHIVAGTGELVEGEPRGAGALVTPQGVVTGSRATGIRIGAFILVYEHKVRNSLHGERDSDVKKSLSLKVPVILQEKNSRSAFKKKKKKFSLMADVQSK